MRYFIWDIETTSLPVYSRFRCMSWTWGTDFTSPVETTFDLCKALDVLHGALASPDTVIIGHNIHTFDLSVMVYAEDNLLERGEYELPEGFPPLREQIRYYRRNVWDTLIFSKKMFPERMLHSMDSWHPEMNMLYDLEPKVEVADYENDPDELIQERCEGDIRIQQGLTKYFCELKGAPDTVSDWDTDTEFLPCVVDLLTSGVPFDLEKAEKVRGTLEMRLLGPNLMKEQLAPGMNWGSNKQVHEWLLANAIKKWGSPELMNLPVELDEEVQLFLENRTEADEKKFEKKLMKFFDVFAKKWALHLSSDLAKFTEERYVKWDLFEKMNGLPLSPKGRPSFNKQNRSSILQKHPVLTWKEMTAEDEKLLGMVDPQKDGFAGNFMAYSPYLGREAVYPSFNLYGTRTNRGAYKEPAIGTFPKHTREIVRVEEDEWLVGLDIVALEMSIIGYVQKMVTGETAIWDQVQSGVNVKQLTLDAFAPAMVNTQLFPGETLQARAKTINYALLYGMAPGTVAKSLGCDEETARACIEVRFPGLLTLNDVIQTMFKGHDPDKGTISTIYGTQVATAKWKSLNTVCQASGAEYAKRMMAFLQKTLSDAYGARMVLWNHDEGQFVVKGREKEELESALAVMDGQLRNYMEGLDDGVGFLTGVDGSVGKNWKETH